MAYAAKIIKDSICNKYRLTTMQLTHPRIVHSEFLTHCAFARNASSSRAIPFRKMVEAVTNDPFIPIYWGKEQSGMQAREEIDGTDLILAKREWIDALSFAIVSAKRLNALGLHKQICNRLLEPWGWITVCVTGDPGAWSNYFAQRCHPDAQPEIEKQARMAMDIYFASSPQELQSGDWHLPYIDTGEEKEIRDHVDVNTLMPVVKVSTGRCARTSYLTQEGKRDFLKDIELHDRLIGGFPKHMSPLEHVAQATGYPTRHAKYTGWHSYRHMIPREYITDFQKS